MIYITNVFKKKNIICLARLVGWASGSLTGWATRAWPGQSAGLKTKAQPNPWDCIGLGMDSTCNGPERAHPRAKITGNLSACLARCWTTFLQV